MIRLPGFYFKSEPKKNENRIEALTGIDPLQIGSIESKQEPSKEVWDQVANPCIRGSGRRAYGFRVLGTMTSGL